MAAALRKQELFDFSLDAQDFKQKLWQQMTEAMAAASLEPVEDHDLEWVSAAGSPHLNPDDKQRCDGKPSRRME